MAFDHLLRLLKYKDALFKLTKIPLVSKVGKKLVDPKGVSLTYIPVTERIEVPPGTAVPASIVEDFINKASHHVILHKCPCRTANECEDFPRDFGCTFLGEATRGVDPRLGRHVSREEALEHYRRAREMGLVSVVGKFKGDALALGVKDHDRLLTLCHCCPCCCISGGLHNAEREFRDSIVKLEGLSVEVTDACNGCGLCVEACIFKQMSLVDGRASVGEECKGCGRCAAACKRGAIRIAVDNPDYIRRCIERISAFVDVT